MNFNMKKTETKFEDKNSKYEQKSIEYSFKILDFGKILNSIKLLFEQNYSK